MTLSNNFGVIIDSRDLVHYISGSDKGMSRTLSKTYLQGLYPENTVISDLWQIFICTCMHTLTSVESHSENNDLIKVMLCLSQSVELQNNVVTEKKLTTLPILSKFGVHKVISYAIQT